MNFDSKKLYELLPALYRIRDTELGMTLLTAEGISTLENLVAHPFENAQGPLQSLLSIIAEQVAVLEENLAQLYDDQFIETCAEWVVPYIGQLVGTRGLIPIPDAPFSQRGAVANTISYRRRKGTASIIEQLAQDVTGWRSNVVEYFQRLATTQYLNHPRPENLSISGLKNWELLEYANTPFDRMPHTVDVRRIERRRGKYNIPNIGIFLWRLGSYTLLKSPAYKVADRCYTFDALGRNAPLYNKAETEKEITHLAEPINVPIPISRRGLSNYLKTYYGKNKSIFIFVNDQPVELAADAPPNAKLQDILSICNLSDIVDSSGTVTGWAHMPQDKIAIDPVLGRLAFPADASPPDKVEVLYYYAFGAEMGGGGYEREYTFTRKAIGPIIEVPSLDYPTIQSALNQLETAGGIVEIKDNAYYFEDLVIKVPKGKTIEIRSKDKLRPILVLNKEIQIEAEEGTSLILNGILISGGYIISKSTNKLELLRLVHCTLIPGSSPAIGTVGEMPLMPRLVINSPDTQVEIEKSIVGAIRVSDIAGKVSIKNSIVDASNSSDIAYSGLLDTEPGSILHIQNSTIIGRVHTLMMEMASNSIFIAEGTPPPVLTQRLQQGCVRFSYFPPGSKIPRPYRCQPTTLAKAAHQVQPMFTSLNYGDPGYCQLSAHCATEITQGADDESEMGAFHHLYQPQRVANLKTRLDEYLRFGLEAGIFFAS